MTLKVTGHGAGGFEGLEMKEECYSAEGVEGWLFTARAQGVGLK
jgi:hypothetical protein